MAQQTTGVASNARTQLSLNRSELMLRLRVTVMRRMRSALWHATRLRRRVAAWLLRFVGSVADWSTCRIGVKARCGPGSRCPLCVRCGQSDRRAVIDDGARHERRYSIAAPRRRCHDSNSTTAGNGGRRGEERRATDDTHTTPPLQGHGAVSSGASEGTAWAREKTAARGGEGTGERRWEKDRQERGEERADSTKLRVAQRKPPRRAAAKKA